MSDERSRRAPDRRKRRRRGPSLRHPTGIPPVLGRLATLVNRSTYIDHKTAKPSPKEADRPSRRGSQGPSGPAERGTQGQRLGINPRIAARRADVEAEEAATWSRRRRRLGSVTIAVVAVICGGGLVLLSPLASVRTIEVVGADRSGAAAVRAASGLGSGPPLVRLDTDVVIARVAALPWVQGVRLERRWPRTVVISVDERQPAALSPCQGPSGPAERGTQGGTCLVDASGRVLALSADDPGAAAVVPRLSGMEPAGAPGASLPDGGRGPLAVAVALPEALRPLVLGVRADGNEVVLDLRAPGRDASPPVVRLGPPERITSKLTAAATVLARTSVNGVAVLDVRVPESPTVTRFRR